jgi:hypothetical protein
MPLIEQIETCVFPKDSGPFDTESHFAYSLTSRLCSMTIEYSVGWAEGLSDSLMDSIGAEKAQTLHVSIPIQHLAERSAYLPHRLVWRV